MEACGTSGMKASLNGVPHLSVADGWWWGAHTQSNGWVIDSGPDKNDAAEADSLYRLLEDKIAPAFYARDEKGIPRQWIRTAKEAIRTVAPHFSARRMVKQYAEEAYAPMAERLVKQPVK